MRKRITGIMLGIVLFIMSPLTVSAAPMVPAPFTSDQLLPVAQAAMAGVTSYQIALVSTSESNKYNPKGYCLFNLSNYGDIQLHSHITGSKHFRCRKKSVR